MSDNIIHTGRKDDQGKLRYDLVPWRALRALAAVLTHGAAKYGEQTWNIPDPKGRYHAALMRHIEAWRSGEDIDPDSGLPHLAHAIANVVFLFEVSQ